MSKYWLAGAVLALAALSSRADPQSTYQWMLRHQIISSVQVQSGQAVAAIGPLFYTGDFPSQQALCGTLLLYLQQQDATIRQLTLIDSTSGTAVGSFANGTLTLSGH